MSRRALLPGTADPSHLLPSTGVPSNGNILRSGLERWHEARYVPSDDGVKLVVGDPVPAKTEYGGGGVLTVIHSGDLTRQQDDNMGRLRGKQAQSERSRANKLKRRTPRVRGRQNGDTGPLDSSLASTKDQQKKKKVRRRCGADLVNNRC